MQTHETRGRKHALEDREDQLAVPRGRRGRASKRHAGPILLVGLISDTHGLLRPEAVAALEGVDHIVHAGDVGAPAVLEALGRLAPVTAVRGNNDRGAWARSLPARAELAVGGRRILVVHEVATLARRAVAADVVVSGHSHRASVEEQGGVLWVNPGSAGPRRFSLPISLAWLRIDERRIAAEIVVLDLESAPRRAL